MQNIYVKIVVRGSNLSSQDIRNIAFNEAKRKLGLDAKKTFIPDMKVVAQTYVPLIGEIVVVEIPGDPWRRWLPKTELKERL